MTRDSTAADSPKPRVVACPQCGKSVEWTPASRWRPFCSERCKMIDLGAWATEAYRIPAVDPPDDDNRPQPEDAEGSDR